jgi:tetratricopeptide (TPR) repeat protein
MSAESVRPGVSNPAGPSGPSGTGVLEARLATLDPAKQPDAWAVGAYRLGVALTESASENPQATAQRALTLFAQAASLLDVNRAPLEHARIVNASGAVWRSVGDRARAIDAFRRAAELMEGRAREVEHGAALSNLGLALAENGDPLSAVSTFERALMVLRPADSRSEPSALIGREESQNNRSNDSMQKNVRSQTNVDNQTNYDNQTNHENHGEQRRAFASATLNLAQALLTMHGQKSVTGVLQQEPQSLARAFSAVADGLRFVDSATAPLQFGMLEHTRGLLWMEEHEFQKARDSFSRCLNVFTRSTFPFQHAIASFNRARAEQSMGALGIALLDYEAAVQVFDPRLHRSQWLEAASRLADVERLLRFNAPSAQRHDHIIDVLLGSTAVDRANLLRERLTRLLGTAPMPQRAEFAMYFAAVQRLSEREVEASDGLLRQTIEILMELPEELLESALLGLLEAESTLSPEVREEADRRLDRAIQELLMGPQRMRMRDILYNAGWERP